MKIGAIDIGSNSVRLMLWADGKTLYKQLKTTRLGEGINASGLLNNEACERTAIAVKQFYDEAIEKGAERVYAFATAAVRSSANPWLFCDRVRQLCGIEVDVVSGEREAQMGLCGSVGSGNGGIIDVGGASTEVTVRSQGKIIYSHSANIGTVRILEAAGRDIKKIKRFVDERISVYGEHDFSQFAMYAIGGTATRIASIKHGLKSYQPNITDGTTLTAEEVHEFALKLTTMSVEEIRNTTICSNSADLVGGGAELLACVMDKFNVKSITVSERDNLEGYVILKEADGEN